MFHAHYPFFGLSFLLSSNTFLMLPFILSACMTCVVGLLRLLFASLVKIASSKFQARGWAQGVLFCDALAFAKVGIYNLFLADHVIFLWFPGAFCSRSQGHKHQDVSFIENMTCDVKY